MSITLNVGDSVHICYNQVIVSGFHLNYFTIEPHRTPPNAQRSPIYPWSFQWPIWAPPFKFKWTPSTSPLDPTVKYFFDFSLMTNTRGLRYNYKENQTRGDIYYVAQKGANFPFNGEIELALQGNPQVQYTRRIPARDSEEGAARDWGFLRVNSIWNGIDFKVKVVGIIIKARDGKIGFLESINTRESSSLARQGKTVFILGYSEMYLVEIPLNHITKI
jgi:hypothetical protein